MYAVDSVNANKMACVVANLIFSKKEKLYAEILDLRKMEEKRINQLN
jgi:hypothetical protein